METWLEIDEFCEAVKLGRAVVDVMINKGELQTKEEDGKIYVEATKGAGSIVKSNMQIHQEEGTFEVTDGKFAEQAIGTILNMHEKVVDAKDETVETLKSENRFLKESLFSLQELYDEDRKTIEALQRQLKISQDEVEFLKRKYKLMWNKAVDNYQKEG